MARSALGVLRRVHSTHLRDSPAEITMNTRRALIAIPLLCMAAVGAEEEQEDEHADAVEAGESAEQKADDEHEDELKELAGAGPWEGAAPPRPAMAEIVANQSDT